MESGRHALVVGIDDYADAPLSGCANDASEVAEALALEQYDFDVKVLLNGEGTRRTLLDCLWSLATGGGEILVVYFAGHGTIHGGGGYVVTVDGVPHDPGIALVELAQVVSDASQRFRHVILILDSCHAGSGSTWVDERPLSAGVVEQEIVAVNASRILLAACRPEQTAKEGVADHPAAIPHGVFTNAVIKGMLGGAVDFDGAVTMHSLYDFVARTIDPVQTPVFKGDAAGSVVLGRGFEPRAGKPIDPSRLTEILPKASRLIDEYQILQTSELSQLSRRRSSGLKACCQELSEIVRWFGETEQSLPDVGRESTWKQCRAAITNYLSAVAHVSLLDVLPSGKILRRIGGGGFGQVWEVDSDGERLAYKVFHGGDLGDAVKPQRFRNGYYSMRKLEHPRIVTVNELTEAPLGFTMQLVGGGDLRDAHVERRDGGVLLDLAYEIADTVRFAHGAGVIHRDIKPENVIMGWDANAEGFAPYLTDFDLAYIETNQTVTVSMVGGVIHYAAPEQFYASRSEAARAATVDVYAIAQLLYFIVCGTDPRAERPIQNRENFQHKVSELFLEQTAGLLMTLYEESSSVDPMLRPQSMESVCEALLKAKVIHAQSRSVTTLTPHEMCKRVGFAYLGVGNYQTLDEGIQMPSRANTLSITLRPRGVASGNTAEFVFTLEVTDRFGMPGASSGSMARTKFNQRIDKRLQRFPETTRRAGSHGFFETHIAVRDVELGSDGVARLTDILSSVIAALETLG